MERWRKIEGYQDYEVSDHGRVRSRKYGDWRIRKAAKTGAYWYLPLRDRNGKAKNFYIHRLVASAFVPGEGEVVRHVDDNPDHNHYKNLKWGSHADNTADKVAKNRHRKGSTVNFAKLTEATALQALRLCASGVPDAKVAERFRVNRATITYLRLRRTWKHLVLTEAPD